MALSAAQLASLEALLATRRGRYSLSAGQRAKLLALFCSSERPSDELPLVIDTEADLSTYLEEWAEFAADAGLDSASDKGNIGRWATASPVAASTPDARAAAVLGLLAERGVPLSASVAAEVTANLRQVGESGDVVAQSTCSTAVCILYTCELPGEELVAWHASRLKALTGKSGKVDIRSNYIYQKLHKNTSKTTLERALLDKDPSNSKLATVKDEVTQHLYAASLPLAATQWQRVLGWAAKHFRYDPAKEKVYLWGYFFCTYRGLGMPEERDRDTLIDMSAPTPGGGTSSIESDMRPTIPGEALTSPHGVMQLGPIVGGPSAAGTGALSLPASIGQSPPQYQGLAELVRMLVSQGLRDQGGTSDEEPPIRELPAPKPAAQKCQFCHNEHDLSVKCSAMKQALRLKAAWDKEEAAKRKAAETTSNPPTPSQPAAGSSVKG